MFKKLLQWIHGRCGTSVSGNWIPQHYKFMPVLDVCTHAFEIVLAQAHPSIIYQITPIAANVPVVLAEATLPCRSGGSSASLQA